MNVMSNKQVLIPEAMAWKMVDAGYWTLEEVEKAIKTDGVCNGFLISKAKISVLL